MIRLWVVLVAQSATDNAASGGAAAGNPADGMTFWQQLLFSPLTMVAVLIILFYSIVLGPERRKATDLAKLRDNLRKNDWVVTVGGICGKVVSAADGEEVVICIDESNGTRMRVLRSAISSIRSAESASSNP
jgi:preprotein translocase subunit YajC